MRTSSKAFRHLWIFLALLTGAVEGFSLTSCSMAPATEKIAEPPRRQVQRQAMRAANWRFVYCLEAGQESEKLVALLQEIAREQPFDKRIEVLDCASVPEDSLGTGPISVFGNRIPNIRNVSFPVQRGDRGWTFNDSVTMAPRDWLLIPAYRNPWSLPGRNPTTATFFLSGDVDEMVRDLREEFVGEWNRMFWPNWAYELHRANGDQYYGSYADTSWSFSAKDEVRLLAADEPVYEGEEIKVFAYDGPAVMEELEEITSGLKKTRTLAAQFLPAALKKNIEVRVYPSLERIGLRRGRMDPIQFDEEKRVLHLVPSFLRPGELLLSAESWRAWMNEDISVDQEYLAYLLQEYFSGQLPGMERRSREALALASTGFYQEQGQNDSPLIRELQLRILARERISRYDLRAGSVTEAVKSGRKEGAQWLKSVVAGGVELDMTMPQRRPNVSVPTYQKHMPREALRGMTFAHEGYRVHNGYGGDKIKASMDSLDELAVNALAVVPYTFMRNPSQPVRLPIVQEAGSENDAATACSIREAKEKGWFVLLKPQIWLGGGHWPGDVGFETDEDWRAFFQHYENWIMHYALLAEREQADALCLGTELVKTTLQRPEDWKAIIEKVRRVYGGKLTYAANWGEEFEGFTFWKELDAIGLNSYYPLAETDEVTDEALLAGARRWMTMAEKVSKRDGRPLWLTEVGFRSVSQPWKNPHAEAGDRSANEEDQARCFRALTTAAAETESLRGMFVWKWPSYLGHRRRGRTTDRGFTPGGKPAATVLGDFYENWE
ncbi:hypothetical protein [Lewinella sp. W8]|uniref:glycoside hydrolase family 113 n=1 Tax=Lewinella sp. W8 TaxID=2528208 RepID=UPI0010679E8D|nr:hypothetical protein [Lewinella sp. W8]MTB51091.1 hypothetical protein [Lewinella sp. W8]